MYRIEYKWGHVIPEYEGEEYTAHLYDDDFCEEEKLCDVKKFDKRLFDGHHLTEKDIEQVLTFDREMIFRYLTETRFGQIKCHHAQRSELWVEVVEDTRVNRIRNIMTIKKKEEKEREGWDEWMDDVFPSYRNND